MAVGGAWTCLLSPGKQDFCPALPGPPGCHGRAQQTRAAWVPVEKNPHLEGCPSSEKTDLENSWVLRGPCSSWLDCPPTHIAGLSGYLEEMATLSPQGQAGRPSSPGALRIRPRCLMAESEARCLKHWGAFLNVADPRVGGSHGLSAGGRNASNQAALHLRSLGTRVRPNARWKRSL